jgi:hypothetical protein
LDQQPGRPQKDNEECKPLMREDVRIDRGMALYGVLQRVGLVHRQQEYNDPDYDVDDSQNYQKCLHDCLALEAILLPGFQPDTNTWSEK